MELAERRFINICVIKRVYLALHRIMVALSMVFSVTLNHWELLRGWLLKVITGQFMPVTHAH